MTETKLSEHVLQAIHSGHTIQAIKRLRAETGLGLKEAKDIVDRETEVYRQANPHSPMKEESSPWGKVIMLALAIAAIYWYMTKGA